MTELFKMKEFRPLFIHLFALIKREWKMFGERNLIKNTSQSPCVTSFRFWFKFPVNLSIYHSIYLSIYLSFYVYIYLSIYLSSLFILACIFYIYTLLFSFFLFEFESNERQNSWTNRAQIFVEHHMTPGKVYEWAKFQKIASNKIRFSLNFENPQHFL